MSRPLCCLLAALILAQGCAHRAELVPERPPPLSEEARARLGTIGLLSARSSPEVQIERRPRTERSGGETAEGAVAGASVGATGAAALLPLALVFPPMLIVAGAVFVVSTVGGAAVGAQQGEPARPALVESTEEAEAAFQALADQELQRDLYARVSRLAGELPSADLVLLDGVGPTSTRAGIDHRVIQAHGVDSVLLAQVETLRLTVEEGEPPLLAVDAAVRAVVLQAPDGVPLDERLFTCRAGKRPLRDWGATSARLFRDAFDRCHDNVAERLLEELLVVYPPPPEPGWSIGGRDFARVAAPSLQPVLTWRQFPGNGSAPPGGVLSRVHQVAYELRIWRVEDGFPGELVYRRTGLAAPVHVVEQPLEPSTSYFWSVRAHFQLDGRPRVTPWALTRERATYAPEVLDRVTHDFYYRITTPTH